VALAEELHFGRAAARLHVSQPTLSGTVKSLEHELGVRLFRRTSRHVELTEAGQVLVAEARRLIADAERAVELVRGSSPEILGPLRVGYPATIDVRWLSSVAAQARRDGRLPEIELVSAEAVELSEELSKGTLHAAFFSGRECHPDLICLSLFREPLLLAVGREHALARAEELRLGNLENQPVVWLRRDLNPLLNDSFQAMCSRQGYRPNIVQEVRTFYEALQFAREGPHLTFLPSSFGSAILDESVLFYDLPNDKLHLECALAYRRDRGSEGVERFIEFVRDRLPSISAVNQC
jgi:DNA-binding transcriptional LysR family regulator